MPENSEELISSIESKLELMWKEIQTLKDTDILAAQVLYEKYKRIAVQLPPPIPTEAVMPTM